MDIRLVAVAAIILMWFVFGLYYGVFKRRRKLPFTLPSAIPTEQSLAETRTDVTRLNKQVERLTKALAVHERNEMRQALVKMADEQVLEMLPEKYHLMNPDDQQIGRPIYLIGGIPVFNKHQELQSMVDKTFLGKYFPQLATKLYNWWHFGAYNTLFFYAAQFLPNGKWAIIGTSKPAVKSGKHMKLPRGAKPYVLLTTQQQTLDELFTNKYEMTKAHAAIILSATILGPLSLKEYTEHQNAVNGWKNN